MSLAPLARLVRMALHGRRLLGTILFVGVVALAAATFVAGINGRSDAGRLWDDAFDRAVGPHATFGASTAANLAGLDSDSRVAASSAPVAAIGSVNLVRPDGEVEVGVHAADRSNLPVVGAPYLVAGHLAAWPTEVAVEQSFADDIGIAVGDRLELRHEVATVEFEVVGLILDFNDCFYPQCDPGVIWTTPDGLDLLGSSDRYVQLFLRLDDPEAAPAFVADTLRVSGDRLTGSQDWLDTRGDALAVNEFFGAFLAGFGVFVLVAAGIVVAGSVTNRVLARRHALLLAAVAIGALTSMHTSRKPVSELVHYE